MRSKAEPILLIGGCGYIGSRLFEYLTNKKYAIDTVDLEWFGNYINPKNIKRDYKSLSSAFIRQYNTIVLLAGNSSIPMSEKKTIHTFKNNVINFVTLLNKIKHQKFIYASSSSVYGNTKAFEITEDYDRYTPTNYYDLTKKEIDYHAQLSNKRYYGLRMGTVCGYSPSLRVDVMINKMYDSAVRDRKIVIFNKIFFRPILGMNDFCRAAENVIRQNVSPGIYNIASFNTTIEEIAYVVAKKLGNITIENIGSNPTYYNFSISTKKFENAFSFSFKDSIESIVSSLIKNYKKSHKSIRI